MGRLNGKVAIVTGAGRGIGRGIARVLADEGASVVAASRTHETVSGVVDEIRAKGGTAEAVVCDVNVRTEVDAVVQEAVTRFGPPDILVNNAQGGGHDIVALDSAADDVFHAAFQGGPMASLYGMQACLPYMKERGGTIVNMGSSTGVNGDPGFGPYGMAKEALRGLTKHAAREWGQFGITVNVVCPAARSDGARQFEENYPEAWEAFVRATPLGFIGDPEVDIAPTVVSLATDLRYLTGATLMLDGGRCILR